MTFGWFMLAGGLAGILAVTELFNAGRKAPCLRACPLLLILFGFDAASAMLAHAVLLEALKGLSWFTGVWPALVAGLCGPAILRSQLSLLGSGQESSFYGPANRYRRLQVYVEGAIDDITSSVQANWIATKAMPAIRHVSLDELRTQTENYVKGLGRLGDDARRKLLEQLQDLFLDPVADEPEKIKGVVQLLVDNNGRRLVKLLMWRGRCIQKPEGRFGRLVSRLLSR